MEFIVFLLAAGMTVSAFGNVLLAGRLDRLEAFVYSLVDDEEEPAEENLPFGLNDYYDYDIYR